MPATTPKKRAPAAFDDSDASMHQMLQEEEEAFALLEQRAIAESLLPEDMWAYQGPPEETPQLSPTQAFLDRLQP